MCEKYHTLSTFTTYGTWLEGEEKGYVKKGKVLEGDKKLREKSRANQKQETVRLTKKQKLLVNNAIREEAVRGGENILALAVFTNHVHVVVSDSDTPIDKMVSRFKKAGYFALRKNGFTGKVWTRGYNKKYCFDVESLKGRIAYVEKHGD